MFYRGIIRGGVWVEFAAFDSKGRNITNKPEMSSAKAQKGKSIGSLLDIKA